MGGGTDLQLGEGHGALFMQEWHLCGPRAWKHFQAL